MQSASAGSLDPVFARRVTLSDLVRWRDKRNSGHLFTSRAPWGGTKCCGCVSSPLAPPFSTFRPVKQTSSSAEVKPSPETPCYIFVLRDKHTSGGSDIDEFVGFLLFVCSEEVSGACGDQTTLEDLVRIYLVFLFFYLILSYIPTFYTLARMSKVC